MSLEPCKGREWTTSMPKQFMDQIQWAHALGPTQYTYKDLIMLKNPFDIALYTKLVGTLKPKTIIEIGSFEGASAIWFADQMRINGLEPNVLSVDIEPPPVTYSGVQFILGDARKLKQTFGDSLLIQPRPWLVIDDADHIAATTLLILVYFHQYLQSGEYIVIEDAIVELMEEPERYAGGPGLAINMFFQRFPDDYEIDAKYCDYYGYNVTWNLNGYLRRL